MVELAHRRRAPRHGSPLSLGQAPQTFASKLMRTIHAVKVATILPILFASANPIVNGDFQTGALVPSTSAYTQSADMLPAQTWAITSFDTLNPSWTDFRDHTTGDASGYFMVVNGSATGGGPSWSQEIVVLPNTHYSLSGWFASVNAAAPAALEFRVRDAPGVIATYAFQLPNTAAVWTNMTCQFNSGSASVLTVEVWDTTALAYGNDYAIDDLSVTVLPQLRITAFLPLQTTLSWSTNAVGFRLETALSLPAASWTAVTNVPAVVGSQFTVAVLATNAQQYFRLHHP